MHIKDLRYLFVVVYQDVDSLPTNVPRDKSTMAVYSYLFNVLTEALLLDEAPRFICKRQHFFAYTSSGALPGVEFDSDEGSATAILETFLSTDPKLRKILPSFFREHDDFALIMTSPLPQLTNSEKSAIRLEMSRRHLPDKAKKMTSFEEVAALQDELLQVLEQHSGLLSRDERE